MDICGYGSRETDMETYQAEQDDPWGGEEESVGEQIVCGRGGVTGARSVGDTAAEAGRPKL